MGLISRVSSRTYRQTNKMSVSRRDDQNIQHPITIESRLRKLSEIEIWIAQALSAASSALSELSRNELTNKSEKAIENELTSQINHLIYIAAHQPSNSFGLHDFYKNIIERNDLIAATGQIYARLNKIREISHNCVVETNYVKSQEQVDKIKQKNETSASNNNETVNEQNHQIS